jgi:hypothetical protein
VYGAVLTGVIAAAFRATSDAEGLDEDVAEADTRALVEEVEGASTPAALKAA